MNLLVYRRALAAAAAAFALTAAHACADTITVAYTDLGQSFSVNNGGTPVSGRAGLFSLSYGGTTGDQFVRVTSGPNRIASFCIDLREYINSSSNTYEIVPLDSAPNYSTGPAAMGAGKASAIARLWKQYVNPDGDGFVNDTDNDSLNNAAIQLAIWEIVYETSGTWDLSSGTFKSLSLASAMTSATTMLGVISNTSLPGATLLAFSAPSGVAGSPFQDQVVEIRPTFGPSVPEPTTLVSLAMMAVAMVGSRLVRRRK